MRSNQTIARLGLVMIVLLIGQYLLGMYTNLFVQIPADVDGWKWMSNSLVIMGHVTVGTLLLVVAVAGLVMAVRARAAAWAVASVAGLVGIGAALLGGSTFMNGQAEAMSFLMATGLGVAIAAYAVGLYAEAQPAVATTAGS
jgi:hypothetical protein